MIIFCNICGEETKEGYFNNKAETLACLCRKCANKVKCHGKMIRVRDLYDDTLVGYSCQDCPHYNLLDDNPV